MGRKKKSGGKRGATKAGRIHITAASLIGVCLALLIIGSSVYSALTSGRYGGFYATALGVLLLCAVVWGTVRKR